VFDISFAELMMIAVVALLVIGPDKLPKVARTMGAYTGRLQRYVAQIKEEVNREVRFEELQKLQEEIKQGANQVQSSMMAGVNGVKDTLKSVETADMQPKRKPVTIKKQPVKKAPAKKAVLKKAAEKDSIIKKSTTAKTTVKPKPDKI
jgi:sec-independent protein translocase protein TatB